MSKGARGVRKGVKRQIRTNVPLMPPMEEYSEVLKEVWDSKWLTNYGEKHAELEARLKGMLKVRHLSLMNNGTLALMVALKALGVRTEAVTTPFTYVATTHALSWNGIAPVFCDIDEDTMCMDPEKAEDAISGATEALLPVHVYGNPCDVRSLGALAKENGLKVLYDAAHAFGAEIDGHPVGAFGDITMFSLHATKLFNTAEGGALAYRNKALRERAASIANFGKGPDDDIVRVGTNAKMSELNAAFGLAVLRYVEAERRRRKAIKRIYCDLLGGLDGIRVYPDAPGLRSSYQYFVLRIDGDRFGASRDRVFEDLMREGIHARRYFYPLVSNLRPYSGLPSASKKNLPVANRVVKEVLTLPFYGAMTDDDVIRICDRFKALSG